ncbi:cytochrome bd-I oxidase subunit CydX [Pseudoalteromonas sp.]|uniref:cytochrome bd-I oxidase subunit CydX n=1 Tax=Pseudoalteromonas sp. TaxID=53249 RepID=UPI0035624AAF
MWYFAWILGVLLACTLGVINVMWYEFQQNKNSIADDEQATHDLLNEHNTNHNDD